MGMGSYYEQVASVVVTDRVTIRTRTADPDFLYFGACGTAWALAEERGEPDVEVIDANGTVKATSVAREECEKRY